MIIILWDKAEQAAITIKEGGGDEETVMVIMTGG
jgi:hypothetical protein